jgi:cellulose synthase/poly-beta-1,6-N-acetylglucosamine synthase-like glycosyltransferase
METLVSFVLLVLAVLVAALVALLLVEVLAAIVLPQRQNDWPTSDGVRNQVAVLMPAHNESSGILPTLRDIHEQLRYGDRILVVADNCMDDTASVAKNSGAEVVERNDPTRHGKGYALDCGIRHLRSNPPGIVLVVDADCRLGKGTIDRLAHTCAVTGRPVQGLYLMTAPINAQVDYQVAELAWRVKNWIRPLGLAALNLPCQLMGTGMAFPWEAIASANLGNERIVEDLRLGLDLALAGQAPVFCPSAHVTSHFATSHEGARTQRRRWEHGHMHTIVAAAPPLLTRAIAHRNWKLLALVIDMAIPPLSFLTLFVAGLLMICGVAAALGYAVAAFKIALIGFLAFLFTGATVWIRFGRDVLPLRSFGRIAYYVLGKLGLYAQFFLGKMDRRWNRTDRTKSKR